MTRRAGVNLLNKCGTGFQPVIPLARTPLMGKQPVRTGWKPVRHQRRSFQLAGRVGVNLLLASGAFLSTLIVVVLLVREPMTQLTPELLASARRVWKEAGVHSYELRYSMHGSAYDVSVQKGIVIDLRVNGQPSTTAQPRAYAVDGLFDTLALELDNLDDPAGPFAGRRDTVLMRVRFHERLGYPERYLRSGGGQARGVVIEDVEIFVRD